MNYIYELEMKVRDYECDLQGIVNNANYQHYLEHTRHEFLTSVGVSFAALHEQGVDPVVARINMAFKTPLKSGDSVGRPFSTVLRRTETNWCSTMQALRTANSLRAVRRKSRRLCSAAIRLFPALKRSFWARTPATM